MTRRHFNFNCRGAMLVGTLDHASSATGLLIVSGGNEVRSGPWGSQAMLAERIAAAGFPVMRFDRRGVGDSEGENAGFEASAPDIAAALRAFKAQVPSLQRVVACGNCDGASALMLAGGEGCDALVLANPWTFEATPAPVKPHAETRPEMTPQRLRAHYLRRIMDPRAWLRLLSGKVRVGALADSLKGASAPPAPPTALAQKIAAGLAAFSGQVTILIAERDRTAQAFLDHWDKADPRLQHCPEASHSFVEPQARTWLEQQILAALRAQ
ncbi:hydrolase 1, exosortase A system-associated [Novosphingobium aquiterrae]|uniref:Hydrolase 1, exosortase A system-associated n=1 Tax=Novosphingobium aquiterrae TaxID=624388 RepID=A0ABV6PGX3_9SPHN